MKQFFKKFVVCVSVLGLSACSALGYGDDFPVRSTVISHRHFSPQEIHVSANTPFHLEFALTDTRRSPVQVSGAQLGFSSLTVPNTPKNAFLAQRLTPPRWRKVHIFVPGLAPGTYEFSCDCFGKPAKGWVIAQ